MYEQPIVMPSPVSLSAEATLATTTTARLSYRFDLPSRRGEIDIVNNDRFAWSDIHVEISDHRNWFQCSALPIIGSGQTLVVQTGLCRSSDAQMPTTTCVLSITARQGSIRSGLEHGCTGIWSAW
jgi:hypothetical protein